MDFEFNNGPFDHGAADLSVACEIAGEGAPAIVPHIAPTLISVAGDGVSTVNTALVLPALQVAGDGAIAASLNPAPALMSIVGEGAAAVAPNLGSQLSSIQMHINLKQLLSHDQHRILYGPALAGSMA